MSVPGYWPNEETGVLRPVVTKYLSGLTLDADEVATMRAYLQQWVDAPLYAGDEVAQLRRLVRTLRTHQDVEEFVRRAFDAGIDPL